MVVFFFEYFFFFFFIFIVIHSFSLAIACFHTLVHNLGEGQQARSMHGAQMHTKTYHGEPTMMMLSTVE